MRTSRRRDPGRCRRRGRRDRSAPQTDRSPAAWRALPGARDDVRARVSWVEEASATEPATQRQRTAGEAGVLLPVHELEVEIGLLCRLDYELAGAVELLVIPAGNRDEPCEPQLLVPGCQF